MINTSRGPIVDNMALYQALRRTTAYAALDVTEPEPIPIDHPLLTLDNIIIAPHIANASVVTRTKIAMIAGEPHCGLERRSSAEFSKSGSVETLD